MPGALIELDCRAHPEALFGSQKPAAVVRQPVLSKHFKRPQEILARH
jgi:hypothetical protein